MRHTFSHVFGVSTSITPPQGLSENLNLILSAKKKKKNIIQLQLWEIVFKGIVQHLRKCACPLPLELVETIHNAPLFFIC